MIKAQKIRCHACDGTGIVRLLQMTGAVVDPRKLDCGVY